MNYVYLRVVHKLWKKKRFLTMVIYFINLISLSINTYNQSIYHLIYASHIKQLLKLHKVDIYLSWLFLMRVLSLPHQSMRPTQGSSHYTVVMIFTSEGTVFAFFRLLQLTSRGGIMNPPFINSNEKSKKLIEFHLKWLRNVH